jgi:hypothetical protein
LKSLFRTGVHHPLQLCALQDWHRHVRQLAGVPPGASRDDVPEAVDDHNGVCGGGAGLLLMLCFSSVRSVTAARVPLHNQTAAALHWHTVGWSMSSWWQRCAAAEGRLAVVVRVTTALSLFPSPSYLSLPSLLLHHFAAARVGGGVLAGKGEVVVTGASNCPGPVLCILK